MVEDEVMKDYTILTKIAPKLCFKLIFVLLVLR